MHDPEHSFEEIEPLYGEDYKSSTGSSSGSYTEEGSQEGSRDEEQGNLQHDVDSDAVSSHGASPNGGVEFDLDSFDLDTED